MIILLDKWQGEIYHRGGQEDFLLEKILYTKAAPFTVNVLCKIGGIYALSGAFMVLVKISEFLIYTKNA